MLFSWWLPSKKLQLGNNLLSHAISEHKLVMQLVRGSSHAWQHCLKLELAAKPLQRALLVRLALPAARIVQMGLLHQSLDGKAKLALSQTDPFHLRATAGRFTSSSWALLHYIT